MPGTTGLHATGAILETSPDNITYTAVAEVASMTPPLEKVMKAKATHLLSPNATKEHVPGLVEIEDAKVALNFKKSVFNSFANSWRRVRQYWRISAPLDAGETTPSRLYWYGFWTSNALGKLDPEDS